jgi:hypothetical protein
VGAVPPIAAIASVFNSESWDRIGIKSLTAIGVAVKTSFSILGIGEAKIGRWSMVVKDISRLVKLGVRLRSELMGTIDKVLRPIFSLRRFGRLKSVVISGDANALDTVASDCTGVDQQIKEDSDHELTQLDIPATLSTARSLQHKIKGISDTGVTAV